MAHGAREPFCSCQGQWIDHVRGRGPSRGIVLDMDSSVSPTHGERENSVWNGHYACTRYHPLFVFNQFGDLDTVPFAFAPATFTVSLLAAVAEDGMSGLVLDR